LAIAAAVIVGLQASSGWSQTDTLVTYWMEPIDVVGQRIYVGRENVPLAKDNLSGVLGRNGFKLIRKGVFFAQDVYADGFKRGDITVVLDGERYHSACPNRMDSPLIRVNPLELESVELMKTGASAQSGLGGLVEFQRRRPVEQLSVTGGLSFSAEAKRSADAVIAVEGRRNRATLRYSEGDPFTDADDRSFIDLYSYKDNYTYRLAEGSVIGEHGRLEYGGNFSYTEDVSFPYLLMDERTNEVYNASAGLNDQKIYFNYTDHLMDNALRAGGMFMETKATNLTIGAVGDLYDVYFRNWDADNWFDLPGDDLYNNMIPDTKTLGGALFKSFETGRFTFSGKIGAVHQRIGNESRTDFYRALYTDVPDNRTFVTYAASAVYARPLWTGWVTGLMIESASESPETEALYIAVQKPMGKPWWSGNPNLDQPVRATLRGSLRYRPIQLELYATHVWDYVYLTRAQSDGTNFLTYKNIEAAVLGVNLNVESTYFDIRATYTWAENRTSGSPLAEIAPFSVYARGKSPRYRGLGGFLGVTYNDAQTRVDDSLNESSTDAWKRMDLGLDYEFDNVLLTLEIDNITNELYYQHLSYLRNPFASGASVWEPGTSVMLGLRISI
jgi:iron complex outermembrane receptor protein